MLKIVTAPDPMLRETCEPCEVGDKSLGQLARQMAKAMYKNDGCGIAAPQVGVLKRLVVIDCDQDSDGKNPIVLVNPVLLETKGESVVSYEGCLSVPGIQVPVERQPWARVRYYDLEGGQWEIEGDGLLGRCLQHEIDHLNGITLLESCKDEAKLNARLAYAKATAKGAKPGNTDTIVEEG